MVCSEICEERALRFVQRMRISYTKRISSTFLKVTEGLGSSYKIFLFFFFHEFVFSNLLHLEPQRVTVRCQLKQKISLVQILLEVRFDKPTERPSQRRFHYQKNSTPLFFSSCFSLPIYSHSERVFFKRCIALEA